jgi:hypothetical protein
MYIFAEPMSEPEIDAIEQKAAARRQAYDEALLRDSPVSEAPLDEETAQQWQDIEDEVVDELLKNSEQRSARAAADDGSSKIGAQRTFPPKNNSIELDSFDPTLSNGVSEQFTGREIDISTPSLVEEKTPENEHSKIEASEQINDTRSKKSSGDTNDRFTDPLTIASSVTEQQIGDDGELETPLMEQAIQESINTSASVTDSTGEAEPDTANSKDILAMVLIIRNKVNGEYVIRPERFKKDDEWEVEYSLQEVVNGKKLYDACRRRRRKAVDALQKTSYSYFQNLLNRFSKKGRKWRQSQDMIDEKMGRTTFTPLDNTTPTLEPEEKLG